MKNPIQPLAKDERGVLRFKANAIVRHLLDTHPDCDLNRLACMDFTDDDRQQFAQLIGYSLSGYGELQSYVDDHAYATAAEMAEHPELTEDKPALLRLRQRLPNCERQQTHCAARWPCCSECTRTTLVHNSS